MSDENDRDLSDLFNARAQQDASPPDDARFVDRVNARLRTRRWIFVALRVALLLAVVVTAAPFVPSFINTLLKVIGL